MTQFYPETRAHGPRLVGDNLPELVAEAMKYVIKEREFYKTEIENRLKERGRAIVSFHSCITRGLEIWLDITSPDNWGKYESVPTRNIL